MCGDVNLSVPISVGVHCGNAPDHTGRCRFGNETGDANRFITSMHWAMTSMTSVGYGDIIAVDTPERVYALIVMLLGGFFYGYMISTMAHLVRICTHTDRPITAIVTGLR